MKIPEIVRVPEFASLLTTRSFFFISFFLRYLAPIFQPLAQYSEGIACDIDLVFIGELLVPSFI